MVRPYLLITGLLFVIVGVRVLIDPVGAFASYVDLQLTTASSFNQIRAGNGGVAVLAGLYMLWAWKRAAHEAAALSVAAVILGGLLAGRIVSLFIDGMPGNNIWFMATFEFVGFVQAVTLRKHLI